MITEHLKQVESLPSGKYAMWWPTPDAPRLINSATARDIQRTYEAFDGFESYAFTFLLQAFGTEVGRNRYELPDNPFVQPLQGPQGRLLALTASQEKGLRFHFDVASTPSAYRDEVWQMVADFAEAFRQALIKQDAVPDPAAELKPLDWWHLCQQAISVTESTRETVQAIGAVLI